MTEVDRRLAANATVTLREQCRWDKCPWNAAIQSRGNESAHILCDATADGDIVDVFLGGGIVDNPLDDCARLFKGLVLLASVKEIFMLNLFKKTKPLLVDIEHLTVDDQDGIRLGKNVFQETVVFMEANLIVSQSRLDSHVEFVHAKNPPSMLMTEPVI